MKKLLLLTKTLLAVALLCVGQNAWGATETYNITSWMNGLDNSYMIEYESDAVFTVNSQNMYMLKDFTQANYTGLRDGYSELTLNSRFACQAHNGEKTQGMYFNRAKSGYYMVARNNARYFSICNLHNGDTFTLTTTGNVYFYSNNATYLVEDVPTAVTGGGSTGTAVVSETTYTVSTTDYTTHVDFYLASWGGFGKIVINSEVVSSPSVGTATNVNTTTGARTLPITAGVSDAENAVTTYWSATTELTPENYSSAGTEVEENSIVTTSDVVYLISVSSTGICSAGITSEASDWGITWNQAATVSLNSVTNHNGWLSSPVFTITGPEGHTSLAYTFTPDGGEESAKTNITSGSTYKPTGKGVLTVYANLTGYLPSSYSIPVSNIYNSSYSTDFTAYTESPFGTNSEDVTSTWWTTAYRSTASSSTTLGRLRFGNNTVTDLVIGYGVGRNGKECQNMQIRRATKGNIEALTIKNNNSTGVTSGTYNTNLLETSGSGAETELSSKFNVTANHTIAQHYCSSPVTDAVLSAILDCESYETSNDFATAIEAESFSTAAEVYAFHSTWQIAKAKASGSTDYSKAIMNKTFELHNTNGWTIYGDPATGGADSDNNGIVEYGEGWSQYYTGWNGRNVSQNISTLPAGTYSLTAKVYSWSGGAPVRLFANGQLSDAENGDDHDPVLNFTVTGNEPSIKIGIGGIGHEDDTDNTWGTWGYRVKNFTLTKTGDIVKLNANGYATYSANYDVEVSGAKAYTAELDLATPKITCHEITSNKIPAGNGVLLYGDAGATVTLSYTTGAEALSNNNLKATTDSEGNLASKTVGHDYYALSGDTFKTLTGDFVHHKAFFEVSTGVVQARSMRIVFGDEVTGISEAQAEVKAAQDGKFFKDGKLFIMKNGVKFNAAGAQVK